MKSYIMNLCLSMIISIGLIGCTNKLTTTQSIEYVEIKAEEKKIEFVKFMLDKSIKQLIDIDRQTIVIDSLPKETNLFILAKWLNENDCLYSNDMDRCYKDTRLYLIKNTYKLDKMVLSNYESNTHINILKDNINTILDSFKK